VVSDFSFSLRSSAKTFAPSAVNKTPKIFIAEEKPRYRRGTQRMS
jgi:hypothetical protein